MSFALYLVHDPEFLKWTDARWDTYFRQDPTPESANLGKAGYVGRAVEAVIHNLENDQPGSRFPLFSRLYDSEAVGWQPSEIPEFLKELTEIRSRLTGLPINRSTFNVDDEAEVQAWIADFRKHNPNRPVRNLDDLYFRFFDTFIEWTERALATRQGIYVAY